MNILKPERQRVSLYDLRAYLHEVLLAASVIGVIILCGSVVSIAWDIRVLRVSHMVAQSELRNALISRIDSLLWRSDTFLDIEKAIQKSMAAGFVQVRVQQAQSSIEQEKAIKAVAASTKEAVKQTLEGASEAMQQAPVPVVNVESAKPASVAPASVVVNPMLSAPRAPTKASDPDVPEKRSGWRWLRFLWPGNWTHHDRNSS